MKKLLLFILAMLLLAGCSSEETPAGTTLSGTNTHQPEGTVDPEWAWMLEEPTGPEATEVVLELTAQSLTESLEFYFLENDSQGGAGYMECIAQARSFEVTSFTQQEDVVTAQVTVTVPDVYGAISKLDLSAYETGEQTDAALCAAIEAAAAVQKQVAVEFTQSTNRWLPVMDDAAADAFYGGLISYMREMTEGVA